MTFLTTLSPGYHNLSASPIPSTSTIQASLSTSRPPSPPLRTTHHPTDRPTPSPRPPPPSHSPIPPSRPSPPLLPRSRSDLLISTERPRCVRAEVGKRLWSLGWPLAVLRISELYPIPKANQITISCRERETKGKWKREGEKQRNGNEHTSCLSANPAFSSSSPPVPAFAFPEVRAPTLASCWASSWW